WSARCRAQLGAGRAAWRSLAGSGAESAPRRGGGGWARHKTLRPFPAALGSLLQATAFARSRSAAKVGSRSRPTARFCSWRYHLLLRPESRRIGHTDRKGHGIGPFFIPPNRIT